jgi:hypothetical protein
MTGCKEKSFADIAKNIASGPSHKSVSPATKEHDETSSSKCRRGNSSSSKSTPPTSISSTPEPTVKESGRARLARSAKKKALASIVTSDAEIENSSISDFLASENQSDSVTETQSTTDLDETEISDIEEEDSVILPAAKRIKPNDEKLKSSGKSAQKFDVI